MCFYNTQRKTQQEYVATLHRHSSKAREGIIAFLSFKSNFIINTVQRYPGAYWTSQFSQHVTYAMIWSKLEVQEL